MAGFTWGWQIGLGSLVLAVVAREVQAELVAHAPEGVTPGKPVWLGLLIQHAPHWHTYWKTSTQKAATSKGVVWLAVASTAKDASDYKSPDDLSTWLKSKGASPTVTLMDLDGKMGRAYGALGRTPGCHGLRAAPGFSAA
ncbi:hypothetical protein [Piscinibacter sp.]|uniref:hypothetical protein n=1 Tax=Piscinibacter sp. TaxID=1903157 RepID=UPI002B9BFE34|nr:hypothetical protein [Albitalea sp.]HUG25217.1 hypothetical protein [Albitalea sp.]